MRIQSINSQNSPACKGTLLINNCKSNVVASFKTSAAQDRIIAANIKAAIPIALGKSFRGANVLSKGSVKELIDSISTVTGDRYIKTLPEVEDKAYAIFCIEPQVKNFLNIKDKFVIYHNM